MSLEERSIRVRNLPPKVTRDHLYELFMQAGPVCNVVYRDDHAFIEFVHKDSVGFALALFEGIALFGQMLDLSAKKPDEVTIFFRLITRKRNFVIIIDCFNIIIYYVINYY